MITEYAIHPMNINYIIEGMKGNYYNPRRWIAIAKTLFGYINRMNAIADFIEQNDDLPPVIFGILVKDWDAYYDRLHQEVYIIMQSHDATDEWIMMYCLPPAW